MWLGPDQTPISARRRSRDGCKSDKCKPGDMRGGIVKSLNVNILHIVLQN